MTKNDTANSKKAAAPTPDAASVADTKRDNDGVENAIKTKAPGNHANAKITAQPGSQGTIDLHKRKSV